MKDSRVEGIPVGQYEVHCTVCGARLGFYAKGTQGNGVPCIRCKRDLSFMVRDGETIVCCKQERG